jgi:hypothetical protein
MGSGSAALRRPGIVRVLGNAIWFFEDANIIYDWQDIARWPKTQTNNSLLVPGCCMYK